MEFKDGLNNNPEKEEPSEEFADSNKEAIEESNSSENANSEKLTDSDIEKIFNDGSKDSKEDESNSDKEDEEDSNEDSEEDNGQEDDSEENELDNDNNEDDESDDDSDSDNTDFSEDEEKDSEENDSTDDEELESDNNDSDSEKNDSDLEDSNEDDNEDSGEDENAPKKFVDVVVEEEKDDDDFLDSNADSDKIREDMLENARRESKKVKPILPSAVPLEFLNDKKENNVFIGMKKSNFSKYGYEGALQVGRVAETEHFNQNIYLDSLNPHVVFICGARGSGKSYSLGVIAEELAVKNKDVGVVVVDPIGVFWSMRYPNKEEKEVKTLTDWGLLPEGLENIKVFIPEGIKDEVPKNTYDETFAIQPALLNGEDWCLTFGIDRFSPSGLLLEKTLQKVKRGFPRKEGKREKGKKNDFGIGDLVDCLENDADLNSREKGFKQDSIRALVSRFEAAKSWGIFSKKGTPLAKLSREAQLTVIDSSFLDDTVTALVIGILARRILAARKISTRREAAQRIKDKDLDQLLEVDIPPTWLFIDEAHTLIPSGNISTPATNAIVEYVKQGRRPGCSLVFATQQPSAIDSRVLSQLDIILSYKLVFDDDIKAVFKRTPTIIPSKYKKSTFLKTLPIGVSMTGDRREESSRAFIMKTRPRKSQHEGRDAETLQAREKINPKDAEKLIYELIKRKIQKESSFTKEDIIDLLELLNQKYRTKLELKKVMEKLSKEQIAINPKIEEEIIEEKKDDGFNEEDEEYSELDEPIEPDEKGDVEKVELLSFPLRISKKDVTTIVDKYRKKKILGFFGEEETIEAMDLKHRALWKVEFDHYLRKNEFFAGICFIDSVTGEFVHFDDGKFVESKGLPFVAKMDNEEIRVLRSIGRYKKDFIQVSELLDLDKNKVKKILRKFVERKVIDLVSENEKEYFILSKNVDLPPSPSSSLLESLKKLPYIQAEVLGKEREEFLKEEIIKSLQIFWPSAVIRRINEVHWPMYHITIKDEKSSRKLVIDGFLGQRIS